MSVLVLIPARGGSKRLPGKNLRTVGGVSLAGHAVRCAQRLVSLPDAYAQIACDTDDVRIGFEAAQRGALVPFLREPEYALDDTTPAGSVIRFLDRGSAHGWPEPRTLVLLQPTSPLRTHWDVKECLDACRRFGMPAVTATEHEGSVLPLANGAVYAIGVAMLRERRSFVEGAMYVHMPPERSIDINTAEDLAEAERLWRLQHG